MVGDTQIGFLDLVPEEKPVDERGGKTFVEINVRQSGPMDSYRDAFAMTQEITLPRYSSTEDLIDLMRDINQMVRDFSFAVPDGVESPL